jgi:hypothetical protein
MKKTFIAIFFIGIVNLYADEGLVSIGLEYGNFFETVFVENIDIDCRLPQSYFNTFGFNIKTYLFNNNKKIGIYNYSVFSVPYISMSWKDNKIVKYEDFSLQIGTIIGPGFRHNLSRKLALQYGIGLNAMFMGWSYNKEYEINTSNLGLIQMNIHYGISSFNFGIGGDIGLRYNITKNLCIAIGTTYNIDFANYINIHSFFGELKDWSKDYFQFGIKPYFSFGYYIDNRFMELF